MKLSAYIRSNMETILQQWEESATVIAPIARHMDKAALRDHAAEMLDFISRDIESPQSEDQKEQKSRGLLKQDLEQTGAESHGAGRMLSGMTLTEVVTEHRALRATVIKHWGEQEQGLEQEDIKDLVRFNESMDQLLSEAVASYSTEKEKQTRLFEAMLSSSSDQIFITDPDSRFLYVNTALTELLHMDNRAITGNHIFELDIPGSLEIHEKTQHVVKSGEQYRGELALRTSLGKVRMFECLYSPVRDNQGRIEAVGGALRDITERKESEYRIWRNANFDMLTGIPNRRLFLDRLEQAIKQSERTHSPFALLFIDLDKFKEANDELGHSGGDLLLKQVAERLTASVREADTVARLGGDEFPAILKDVDDPQKITTAAEKILHALAEPFQIKTQRVSISASIGIIQFPRDGTAIDKLMGRADQAMYTAKQRGGNQLVFYDRSMGKIESEHSRIARGLQAAIARNEFEIHYQPIVNLSSGAIGKAEALLRWRHPESGLLSPITFMDIAEQTGKMNTIDEWVFREAAARSRAWSKARGQDLEISINKATPSFLTRNRLQKWARAFEAVDLSESHIIVELSEGALSSAFATSVDLMRGLGQAGIALAVDDFGVGQFSMAALKACGVAYLKLDQTYVQGVQASADDAAITHAIIAMAHKMGLKTIAEGVETEAQRTELVKAGCDFGQGFLFSKPLPEAEFKRFLDKNP